MFAKDPDIAGFVKMRDASLFDQPGVEFLGGGQLDELARHDEDQFTAWFQVADALFDEEQEEIAAAVEQCRFQAFFRVDRDILQTDIGRVADDGVELLAEWKVEKIAYLGTFRRNPRVNFDAGAIRLPGFQYIEESAVARRRLKNPAGVPAEVEHESHHIGGREDLAELGNVAGHAQEETSLPGDGLDDSASLAFFSQYRSFLLSSAKR